MGEKLALHLLVLSIALQSVACGHVFFHESSAILVKADGIPNPHSSFGFAMGHWNESLIISAPTSDLNGTVYSCPLAGISSISLSCSWLDLFNSTTFTRDVNPDQNFYLGASIATTKDYLFTCAPLVTKYIRKGEITDLDAIGSCFIYSNNTSIEYLGPESRFVRDNKHTVDQIDGGTGWNTYADEKNGVLLVAKTSVYGDVNYLNIYHPEEIPQGLANIDENYTKQDNDIYDVGYGITAGKFFSDDRALLYAVSKQSTASTGQIIFLKEVKDEEEEEEEEEEDKTLKMIDAMIDHDVVGAMFGYALAAADLTGDGLAELLAGAPMQSEDKDEVEFGALHIYLGGDKGSVNAVNRKRTIFGAKTMGRFGSAIVASDIDGDSIPEVFVSAPYEGSGVVYILSGHELSTTLLRASSPLTTQVSRLQHTQRVARADLDLLGFSLLTLPDVDGNGCYELAVGAPGAASALVLRCLQTINVTVTSELIGSSVKEKDNHFTARVCLKIGYSKNSANISGYISVNNYIDGNAKIMKENFKVDLAEKNENHCEDILVTLLQHEKYDYEMRTKLELENTEKLAPNGFDKSWAQLSTYSKTESNLTILRRCSGDDCNPQLYLDIKWSNTEPTHLYESKGSKNKTYERLWYEVESSKEETVSFVVENKGYEASEACVWVEIVGAPVYKPGKCSPKPPENPKGYECALPTSFRRTDKTSFEIFLNMSRLSNVDKALVVTAQPYENCIQKLSKHSRGGNLTINYQFQQAWQKVQVEGTKQDLSVSDIEIKETTKENNQNNYKISHQYKMTNKGSVTWGRSVAVIELENKPFIESASATDCAVLKSALKYEITCPVFLDTATTKTIIAWVEMSRKEVDENLNGGRQMNVSSQMKLFMDSTLEKTAFVQENLVSKVIMKTDISFKNNQMLIGLVAAILGALLLALVTCCLCKHGFFKREEKKKLNVLRESVRRHSIRLTSERSSRRPSQKTPSNADDYNDIDIEVVSDSPFEEIPISLNDDVVLVKAKAEIHKEDKKIGNTKNKKNT